MKSAVIVLAIFLQIIIVKAQNNTIYTTKYDDIDINEIIASKRLLDPYIDCLLDEGPCTAEGKELKKNIPDAIQNECEKCSEKQRESSNTLVKFLMSNRTEDWEKLNHKYNGNDTHN